MPTTTYTVFDIEMLSENRAATVRDYVPDPLGSTVALLDNTQAQTDTFSYWPYGEERSRTGTTATPFGFLGSRASYTDGSHRIEHLGVPVHVNHGRYFKQVSPEVSFFTTNGYSFSRNSPTTVAGYRVGPSKMGSITGPWWPIQLGPWGGQAIKCLLVARILIDLYGLEKDWIPIQDKLAHCTASCILKECGGARLAWIAGIIKEAKPGGQSWWEFTDFCANNRGEWCVPIKYQTCMNACRAAIRFIAPLVSTTRHPGIHHQALVSRILGLISFQTQKASAPEVLVLTWIRLDRDQLVRFTYANVRVMELGVVVPSI